MVLLPGSITIIGGLVYYLFYRESPATKANGGQSLKGTAGEWGFLPRRQHVARYPYVDHLRRRTVRYAQLIWCFFFTTRPGLDIALASVCLAITQLGGIFARIALGIVSDTVF